jgi:hypothetical protein
MTDKIDTQGMSLPGESKKPSRFTPMEVTPRRLLSPEFVKEMKILINEILDQREGKMDYDSYFDVDKFKYDVK